MPPKKLVQPKSSHAASAGGSAAAVPMSPTQQRDLFLSGAQESISKIAGIIKKGDIDNLEVGASALANFTSIILRYFDSFDETQKKFVAGLLSNLFLVNIALDKAISELGEHGNTRISNECARCSTAIELLTVKLVGDGCATEEISEDGTTSIIIKGDNPTGKLRFLGETGNPGIINALTSKAKIVSSDGIEALRKQIEDADFAAGSPRVTTPSATKRAAELAVEAMAKMEDESLLVKRIKASKFFKIESSKGSVASAVGSAPIKFMEIAEGEDGSKDSLPTLKPGMKKEDIALKAAELYLGVFRNILVRPETLPSPKLVANLDVYNSFLNRAAINLGFCNTDREVDRVLKKCDDFFNKNDAPLQGFEFPVHLVLKGNLCIQKKLYKDAVEFYLKAHEEAIKFPGTITQDAFDTLRFQVLNSVFLLAKDLDSKEDVQFLSQLIEILKEIEDQKFGKLDKLVSLAINIKSNDIKANLENFTYLKSYYEENLEFHPLARIFFFTELTKAAVSLNIPASEFKALIAGYKEWLNTEIIVYKSGVNVSEHEPLRAFAIALLNQGNFEEAESCINSLIESGDISTSSALIKALAITSNEGAFECNPKNISKYLAALEILGNFISFSRNSVGATHVDFKTDLFNLEKSNYLVLIQNYIGLLEKLNKTLPSKALQEAKALKDIEFFKMDSEVEKLDALRQYYGFVGQYIEAIENNDIPILASSQVDFGIINHLKILCSTSNQFNIDQTFASTFSESKKANSLQAIDILLAKKEQYISISSKELSKLLFVVLFKFREFAKAEALYANILIEFTGEEAIEFSMPEKCFIAAMFHNLGKKREAFEQLKKIEEQCMSDKLKLVFARSLMEDAAERQLGIDAEEFKQAAKLFGEVKNLETYEDSYLFCLEAIGDKATLAKVLPKIQSRTDIYWEAKCEMEFRKNNFAGSIKAAEEFFKLDNVTCVTRSQNVVNAHILSIYKVDKIYDAVAKAIEYKSKGFELEREDKNFFYASCFLKTQKGSKVVTLEMLENLGVAASEIETLCKNTIVVALMEKKFSEAKKLVDDFAKIFPSKDFVKDLRPQEGLSENDIKYFSALVLIDKKQTSEALVLLDGLVQSDYKFDIKILGIKPSQHKLLQPVSSKFINMFPNEIKVKVAKYFANEAKEYQKAVDIFKTINLHDLPQEAMQFYASSLLETNNLDQAIELAKELQDKSHLYFYQTLKNFKSGHLESTLESANSYLEVLKPSAKPSQEIADKHIESLFKLGKYAELAEKVKQYKAKGVAVDLFSMSEILAERVVKEQDIKLEDLVEFGVKEDDVIKCYKDFMVSLVQAGKYQEAKKLYEKFVEILPGKDFDEVFIGTRGILGEDVLYFEAMNYLEKGDFVAAYDECNKLNESGYVHSLFQKTYIEASIKADMPQTALFLLDENPEAETIAANFQTSLHELYVKAVKACIYNCEYEEALKYFEKIQNDFTPDDLKYIADIEVTDKAAEEMTMDFAYLLASKYQETKNEQLKEVAEPLLEGLYQCGYKPNHITAIGEWFLYGKPPCAATIDLEA